jgi:hypothetical protein
VEFIDAPTGRRGRICGNTILIDQHQLQEERCCTVAHELVHDERRIFPRIPSCAPESRLSWSAPRRAA